MPEDPPDLVARKLLRVNLSDLAAMGATPRFALVSLFLPTDLPLDVLDVPAAEVRDLYERDLVLIRPDQYIAWRGNALPSDLDGLLAKATGAT